MHKNAITLKINIDLALFKSKNNVQHQKINRNW
jgi:hypothetical protein